MKRTALFMIVIISFLLRVCIPRAYAVSISIDSIPVSVDQSQEVEAGVLLQCTGCSSDSFLRAVFYSGGTSYFGFTQNNSGEWINTPGGSCDKYFRVSSTDIIEGSWSGKLKIKPDISSSYFTGPGEYLFKIARYTASCNSPTWSAERTIAITGPTKSPTPQSTSTPTHTMTPVPTTTPTMTQAPTNTSTPIPTQIVVLPTDYNDEVSEIASVSASMNASEVLGEAYSTPSSESSVKPYIISSLFLAIGFALLSAVVAWKISSGIMTK